MVMKMKEKPHLDGGRNLEKQGSAIAGFNSLSLSLLHSETHATTETQMLK